MLFAEKTPWGLAGTSLSSSSTWTAWQKCTIYAAIVPTLGDCKHCQYNSAPLHQAGQAIMSFDI